MIVLFVHPESEAKYDQYIGSHEQMKPDRRDGGLNDDFAEIADEQVHRVEQEQVLRHGAVAVNAVKDGGHIHQQLGKDRPQVLDVPEEDKQRRQDQPHADVKQHQTADGVEQHHELPRKRDAVQCAEQEEHAQGQPEVDQGLHVLGKQKQVLGYVHLGEDARVAHEGGHTLRRGLIEVREHQVSAEQIGGVVRHTPTKKLRKDQPHDQQGQQRRQHAPGHAQNGAFVFLFEITLDQFLEEKAVLKPFQKHATPLLNAVST